MWKSIPEFSDYAINEAGSIYRKSTNQLFVDKRTFSFKDDMGVWRNRSVNKLLAEIHGVRSEVIKAVPIQLDEGEQTFTTIKEAATWLRENRKAITAGRLAAMSTIRTNISLGISQPELYPYMYGYQWKIQTKE